MNVLFFYQHFWPDSPPYANMLRAIGAHLSEQDYTPGMLTGEPSYKTTDRSDRVVATEVVDGIQVRRLRLLPGARSVNVLRLLSKAIWPVRALGVVLWDAIRGKRQDVIVSATIPPVANGLCGLLAARLTGAKFVYHLQDIYPEIGSAGGLWSERSLRHRLLLVLDSYTCRMADRCVVLSQDMADALIKRKVSSSKVHIINNFMLVSFDADQATESAVPPAPENLPGAQGRFRLVFAGNLGRFQGLEALVQAYLALPQIHDDLELHFLGEGAAMQALLNLANDHPRVFFHGHRPFDQASGFMSMCDAGVVSIQPDIFRYAYPSKTLSYVGQGLPVFALVEQESALAREVVDLEIGVSASNTDEQALQKGFEDLVLFLRSDANDRDRIRRLTDSLYSHPVAMKHWTNLMDGLAESPNSSLESSP